MVTKSDTGGLRKKKCKLGSRCTGKMFSGAFIDGKRPRGACDGSGRRLFLFLGTWTRQRRCARSAQRREGGSCERGAIGLEEMRINHTSLCTGRNERKKEGREWRPCMDIRRFDAFLLVRLVFIMNDTFFSTLKAHV